jgi:hypothetical protein
MPSSSNRGSYRVSLAQGPTVNNCDTSTHRGSRSIISDRIQPRLLQQVWADMATDNLTLGDATPATMSVVCLCASVVPYIPPLPAARMAWHALMRICVWNEPHRNEPHWNEPHRNDVNMYVICDANAAAERHPAHSLTRCAAASPARALALVRGPPSPSEARQSAWTYTPKTSAPPVLASSWPAKGSAAEAHSEALPAESGW